MGEYLHTQKIAHPEKGLFLCQDQGYAARKYMDEKEIISQQPLRFGAQMTKPHAVWAILAFTASGTAQILGTSVSYIFRGVIDTATRFQAGDVAFATVVMWVIAYPTFIVLEAVIWRVSGFMGMRWVTGFNATGHRALFGYLTEHSQTYFANRFAGAVANKIAHAIDGVSRIIESILWNYLPTFLAFLASIIFAYLASPILAGVFVFWIVVVIPVNMYLARHVSTLSFKESEQKSKLRGIVVDVFTNIVAVQQYARRNREQEFVGSEIETLRKLELKSWIASELQLLLNNAVFVGGFVVSVVAVAFWLWEAGSITLGEFVMSLTLTTSLISSLTFIGMSMKNFAEHYGNAKEGLEEILKPHDITDFPKAKKLEVKRGEIHFNRVGFAYGTRNVFTQFELTIPGGQRVGIVGPSGSGKTTFVSLLLRQQDVHEGEVQIDGQNIRKVTLNSLREAIAIVPQEPALFHRSLKENIGYGKPDATQEEIESAARKAQAHEFITELPQGYETLVGERGVKLSGGQRQRVAIARAILKNAPILILDEATSALDSESEVVIQQALEELMRGKTVIAIAHRLSTIKAMDRIIVLDGGSMVEDGSHDELVEGGGTYARLWAHQAGGFLREET